MKKIIMIATALMTVISATAQEKLNFEAPIQVQPSGSSPRYASNVSVTILPTFSKCDGNGLVGLLETCHGISWDEHLFTGLGTGVSYSFFSEDVFIPVFMEGRYTLSWKGKLMPFFSLRLGGMFCTDRYSNHFNVNPSVGLTLKRFSFSAGYYFDTGIAKNNRHLWNGTLDRIITTATTHGFTLRIAYSLF